MTRVAALGGALRQREPLHAAARGVEEQASAGSDERPIAGHPAQTSEPGIQLGPPAQASQPPPSAGERDGQAGRDGQPSAPDAVGGACAAVTQTAVNRLQPADIIFAIDNSESMDAEFAFVREEMNDFSRRIVASGIDVLCQVLGWRWHDALRPSRPNSKPPVVGRAMLFGSQSAHIGCQLLGWR